jgi:hypothetical protein
MDNIYINGPADLSTMSGHVKVMCELVDKSIRLIRTAFIHILLTRCKEHKGIYIYTTKAQVHTFFNLKCNYEFIILACTYITNYIYVV